MSGKCPKCEKSMGSLRIQGCDGNVVGGRSFKVIAICCPFCSTVLSAQIDPIAIKSDIVADIKKLLR
jgi:hypothetical protein